MEANKEIVKLFEEYKGMVGNQQTETAAMLVLAHVLLELQKTPTLGDMAEAVVNEFFPKDKKT